MKKIATGVRFIAAVCAVFGWWGLFYPELALTPETVRVFYQEQDGRQQDITGEWEFDNNLLWELMDAEAGEIQFKSRLFKELSALLKKE